MNDRDGVLSRLGGTFLCALTLVIVIGDLGGPHVARDTARSLGGSDSWPSTCLGTQPLCKCSAGSADTQDASRSAVEALLADLAAEAGIANEPSLIAVPEYLERFSCVVMSASRILIGCGSWPVSNRKVWNAASVIGQKCGHRTNAARQAARRSLRRAARGPERAALAGGAADRRGAAWNVGLIVGPSGCGKSTLRRVFRRTTGTDLAGRPGDCGRVSAGNRHQGDRCLAFERRILEPTRLASTVSRTLDGPTIPRANCPGPWLNHPARRSSTNLRQSSIGLSQDRIGCHRERFVLMDESSSPSLATMTSSIGSIPTWTYDPAVDQFTWRSLRGRPRLTVEICPSARFGMATFQASSLSSTPT